MKNQTFVRFSPKWLLLAGVLSTAAQVQAVDLEEGGYYGTTTEGHSTVVANFLVWFAPNQYYYATGSQFTSSNNSYVDAMDIALFAGHGNRFQIGAGSTWLDLSKAGGTSNRGYGDNDLEVIAFESCYVVPSPLETSDWSSAWVSESDDIFDNLHQALGFRTASYQSTDQDVSSYFGRQVSSNFAVWQAWFDASSIYGLSTEFASAVMNPNCQYDTYSTACADSGETSTALTVWYQH